MKYFAQGGLVHIANPAKPTILLCGEPLAKNSLEVVEQRVRCDGCVTVVVAARVVPNGYLRDRKRPVRRK